MDLPFPLGVLIIAFLVATNAFFVAAEFALVSARTERIEHLAEQGSRAARLVLAAQKDPNRFISTAQLGITVASLLLGWLGEETLARMFVGPLGWLLPEEQALIGAHGVASVLAIAFITFLHITLGEQVPKMVALSRPESIVVFAAIPTEIVARTFRPITALLYATTNLTLRLLGVDFRAEQHAVHSPDELQTLVRRSARAGLLTKLEHDMLKGAFGFGELTAAEVMVPRTEMVALPVESSLEEAIKAALRHRHSRFPVYEESRDNVVGVLSAKDLLAVAARRRRADPRGGTDSRSEAGGPRGAAPRIKGTSPSPGRGQGDGDPNLRRLLRPPVIVHGGTEAFQVLASMKAARQPMAVVLDEYGGTLGIVTLKDLVARLVGEIGDEYAPANQEVREIADGSYIVDGLALVADVNSRLGTRFDATEVDTIGGLVFSRLGRRPRRGDEVTLENSTAGTSGRYQARVDRLDGLRVARVRLLRAPSADREPRPGTAPADEPDSRP